MLELEAHLNKMRFRRNKFLVSHVRKNPSPNTGQEKITFLQA
jgi:hypothetical protein